MPQITPAAPPNDGQMQECIDQCLLCYRTCLEVASNTCLRLGGKHAEQQHFSLMLSCANLCNTAANFMLMRSKLHAKVCGVCAEVCEACAHSCAEIGGMDELVQICRRCADLCRRMAMGAMQQA